MHTYPYMCEEISGTKQMPQNNTRKTCDYFNFSNTIYPFTLPSFVPNAPFLYPLKQKILRLSDVFKGNRKVALGTNGLFNYSL